MNSLMTELAPIPDAAWGKIQKDTHDALREHLIGRRVVDFDGPHSLTRGAVNLGTLEVADLGGGLTGGLRAVQPLFEVRVPFTLSRRAVDDAARGAPAFDTGPAVDAARKLAELEDRAILLGLAPAKIRGLSQVSPYSRLSLGPDPLAYGDVIASALIQLDDAAIAGPYALLLGSGPYRRLAGVSSGYPPLQQLSKLLGGPILHSRVLDGGLLLSLRGDDFRLTVGQDAAIGYTQHDAERIDLYLVETFTFLVIAEEAVVALAP